MFKVKIIVVGRCKDQWLSSAIGEYEKRLRGTIALDWVITSRSTDVQALCKKEPFYIALDSQGDLLTSEEFCTQWLRFGVRTTFVIGGPTGLSKELLAAARWRWSLSPLTFTNQIVRLLLIEQLYRATEIMQGTPYHK